MPRRGDQIGMYVIEIRDPAQAAHVAQDVDATFKNSLAETLTETEKAFQLGFVAMTEAILVAIASRVVRRHPDHHGGDGQHHGDDRSRALWRVCDAEGAGLRPRLCLRALIFGESLGIALVGCAARDRSSLFRWRPPLGGALGTLFPVFRVAPETALMQVGARRLASACAAASVPAMARGDA